MSKRTKWILIATALILIGFISYYIITIVKFGNDIHEPEDSRFSQFREEEQPKEADNLPPEWEGTERVNILLLGADARGLSQNEAPRSDTLMVASIDPVEKNGHLFSILRDAYTDIPGYYATRINAALALGGPHLAMKTVSEYLDIPIQYYVYVDFEGFIALIDAIGGIEFEVEKNMYHYDPSDPSEYHINLKAGLQKLDGNKTLQYVRFRNDLRTDYARTERQREIMFTVVDKIKSTSSILRLPHTLEKIQPYIETNISLTDMWKLANLAYGLNMGQVISEQIPPNHLMREQVIRDMDVVTANPEQLQVYVQELFDPPVADEPESEEVDTIEAN